MSKKGTYVLLTESGHMPTRKSISNIKDDIRRKFQLDEVEITNELSWNNPAILINDIKDLDDLSGIIALCDASKIAFLASTAIDEFIRGHEADKTKTSWQLVVSTTRRYIKK